MVLPAMGVEPFGCCERKRMGPSARLSLSVSIFQLDRQYKLIFQSNNLCAEGRVL